VNWKDAERNGVDLLQIIIPTVAFWTDGAPEEPQSCIPVEILTPRLPNISQKCLCLSQVSQYKTGKVYPSLRQMF